MSFLDRLRERYADVFAPAPEPTETAAVERDRFDEAAFAEVRAAVPSIERSIVELSATHDYVEDFTEDFFNLALKADPNVRTPDELVASHKPHAGMIDSFAKMPEVQQMRTLTANDQYAAAMAVVAMQDQIADAYVSMEAARAAAEEMAQRQQEARDAAQAALDAAGAAEADAEDAEDGEPSQEAQDAAEAAAQAAQQASTAALEAAARLADEMAGAQAGMKAQMKSAAKAAADAAQEESDLMSAFGVDPGDLQKMSFKERADLAKRLRNNRMAKFATLIGMFRRMAEAEQRRRVSTVADEIVGVKLGSDLARLTPQEMVNLAVPETEDDFWYRWANDSLLVYDLAGNEKQGKGPIIAVCDESGSMGAQFGRHGTREAWSKGFCLALLDQARRQNRDFHYIGFGSHNEQWQISFPEGKGPIDDILKMTEHFWNGGTEYERPLGMALDIMERHYAETGKPKPDVVFISDDEYGGLADHFMKRWLQTKDRTGMRCFGVAICAGFGGAMKAVSDDVRSILDMTSDPASVKDIFRTI